jgi:myo-inositol 2-dehydrogenase/D-chiro-inositol 1-dehydrogenase
MKKVKLGLVGLGGMGLIHFRNCLALESAEISAVSDLSKTARSYAQRLNVQNVYSDYRELLKDQSIAAVIISLPNHLHKECVEAVAEAGKDIFLEKPLARNIIEGKEVLSVVKKNGVRLMVGYPMRFNSSFLALKRKMQNGALGEIQSVYSALVNSGPFQHRVEDDAPRPVPNWWFNKELSGGGVLLDLGCHLINLLRWYFGEVSNVNSFLKHKFNLEMEDQATLIVKFKCGPIAILNVGWYSLEPLCKVELIGTVKQASAFETRSLGTLSKVKSVLTKSKFQEAYFKEIEYFVSCIQNDVVPCTSGQDALEDLRVISLAYENQAEWGLN